MYLLSSFIDIPSATTTIAQAYEQGNPYFQALLPVAYVAIGVSIGVSVAIFLMNFIPEYLNNLFHKKDDI